jgi:hypothetical protein
MRPVKLLEENWKRASIIRGGDRTQAKATVRYTSLAEWNTLRGALARSPLVSDFRTTAVARDGAVVTFAYLGDPQRLQNDLLQRGVALGDEPQRGMGAPLGHFCCRSSVSKRPTLSTGQPDQMSFAFPAGPLRFGQLVVTPANQAAVSIVRQPDKWPTPVFCVTGPQRCGLTTPCCRHGALKLVAFISTRTEFTKLKSAQLDELCRDNSLRSTTQTKL